MTGLRSLNDIAQILPDSVEIKHRNGSENDNSPKTSGRNEYKKFCKKQ